MTEDKLREACERVAKRWLGWGIRTEPRCKPQWYTGPEFYNTPHAITRPGSAVLWPEEITRLASPKGMDLLLDAIKEKGWVWSARDMWEYDEGVRFRVHNLPLTQIGEATDKNRYAALIFALDKVEVLDENS